MPRGTTPRRPAKTGRQEGTRKAIGKKPGVLRTPRTSEGVRPHLVRAKGKAYNPIAPGRVAEILKRLDQAYPWMSLVPCTTTAPGNWWWPQFFLRSVPTYA